MREVQFFTNYMGCTSCRDTRKRIRPSQRANICNGCNGISCTLPTARSGVAKLLPVCLKVNSIIRLPL